MSSLRTSIFVTTTLSVCLLLSACGGNSGFSSNTGGGGNNGGGGNGNGGGAVQTPTILWAGDSQISSGLGDHGVATAGPPGVALLADNAGGAFVAWEDPVYLVVRVQHEDASGHRTWQDSGFVVTTTNAYQASPRAVSDGSGGFIVAWIDGRRDGFCDPAFLGTCDIYAQRFDATGQMLWDPLGMPIATVGNSGSGHGFAMISDGSAGAIIVWEGGTTGAMYAQKINTNGQPQWPVNGVQVSPTPTVQLSSSGAPPRIASDGAGGVIVSWWNVQYSDPTAQPTVSAQHVSSAGQLLWDPNGITVAPIRWQNGSDYAMASDGSGGAIFFGANPNISNVPTTWTMTLQHLNSAGQNMWGTSGVALTGELSPELAPAATEDGSGGAFVAWQSCEQQSPDCQIKSHHISSTGALAWPSIAQLTSVAGEKFGPQLLADGSGGVVAFWSDCRNGTPSNCVGIMDIYAQRINTAGKQLWQANGDAVSAAAGNQGIEYSGGVSGIAVANDKQGGALLAWPDGRNSRCMIINYPPSTCDLFGQRIRY